MHYSYVKLGGFSFQLDRVRFLHSVAFDNGKTLLSTMKTANEPLAIGMTQRLSASTSEPLSMKFKPVHMNSAEMKFGLTYSRQNREQQVFLDCAISKSTSLITCDNDGRITTLSKDVKLTVNLDDVNAEYCVEVSRETRTLRFLVNGEQLHDGDIPIPLSKNQINGSWFSVSLFSPGDCVRISD